MRPVTGFDGETAAVATSFAGVAGAGFVAAILVSLTALATSLVVGAFAASCCFGCAMGRCATRGAVEVAAFAWR